MFIYGLVNKRSFWHVILLSKKGKKKKKINLNKICSSLNRSVLRRALLSLRCKILFNSKLCTYCNNYIPSKLIKLLRHLCVHLNTSNFHWISTHTHSYIKIWVFVHTQNSAIKSTINPCHRNPIIWREKKNLFRNLWTPQRSG